MNLEIVALDDEKPALYRLTKALKEAVPDAHVLSFSTVGEVMEHIEENANIDFAFLDIEMPGMTGLELAKKMKELSPRTKLIFVTGFTQYAAEAYADRINGYIMKPVTKEKILNEIQYQNEFEYKTEKKLRVQTFGNFDVFYGEEHLKFRYAKTKELLAFLVDRRGASCNMAEICAILWEDRALSNSLKTQYRNLISDLKHTLEEIGCSDIITRNGREISVCPAKFQCDLYDFLNMDVAAVNRYNGEYMTQYSWAEITLASLKKYL